MKTTQKKMANPTDFQPERNYESSKILLTFSARVHSSFRCVYRSFGVLKLSYSYFFYQIDALLPNVRPKPSKIPPLDRFLLSLHTFILSIPSIPQRHPLEAARKLLKKGVAVPYSLPLPTEETNWKVGYSPPSDITLVGSWANKISVKQKDRLKYGVDLAVEMPDVSLSSEFV